MQGQSISPHPLARHLHHAPRVVLPFEAHHEVVAIADQSCLTSQPRLHFAFEPDVQHVVQINVAEQGNEHRPLGCADVRLGVLPSVRIGLLNGRFAPSLACDLERGRLSPSLDSLRENQTGQDDPVHKVLSALFAAPEAGPSTSCSDVPSFHTFSPQVLNTRVSDGFCLTDIPVQDAAILDVRRGRWCNFSPAVDLPR